MAEGSDRLRQLAALPGLVEQVDAVVLAWRRYVETSTIGNLHGALNALERAWPVRETQQGEHQP